MHISWKIYRAGWKRSPFEATLMCTYVCRYRWWLYQILAYCLHFPLYTSFEGSVWIQEVVNSHISSSYGRDRMPASILVCVCVGYHTYTSMCFYELCLHFVAKRFLPLSHTRLICILLLNSDADIIPGIIVLSYRWQCSRLKKRKSSTHGFVWATEAAEVTAPTSVPKYHSSVLFLQPTISSYPLRISGSVKVSSTSSSHSQYPQYIEQWSYFEK